jgi:hypothetical protein
MRILDIDSISANTSDGKGIGGMAVISVERVIARPPRTVFDFVATHHFQNHPKWDPDVLEMTQTSPGAVGTGTTAKGCASPRR